MIDLTPYFNILGLPPDATWDQVEQRYRTLVIFWHPDRVSSPHHKALAEEELKKINNAKDKLKERWRDWQNRTRSSASHGHSSASQPGNARNEKAEKTNQDKKRADEEAKQKRESEKRRREEQRQQQADFKPAYQQYTSSKRDKIIEEAKQSVLGKRLLKYALFSSIILSLIAIASEGIAKQWTSAIRSNEVFEHRELSFTIGHKK